MAESATVCIHDVTSSEALGNDFRFKSLIRTKVYLWQRGDEICLSSCMIRKIEKGVIDLVVLNGKHSTV